MCTVHFPLFVNVAQLVIWEYHHYFWDTANNVFVSFSFCCEVQVQRGEDIISACWCSLSLCNSNRPSYFILIPIFWTVLAVHPWKMKRKKKETKKETKTKKPDFYNQVLNSLLPFLHGPFMTLYAIWRLTLPCFFTAESDARFMQYSKVYSKVLFHWHLKEKI